MKRVLKLMGQGLALVLPLILTVWILWTFASWIESLLAEPLKGVIGDRYRAGMGIAAGIVLALVLGILARVWLVSTLLRWIERFVRRVPLVKLLYDSIRDMMGFVDSDRKSFTRCVLVKLPNTDSYTPGFVTRETMEDIPTLRHLEGYISVYVSAAYGFMGLLLLVRREDVVPLEMSVGDGMRFVLSGAVSASDDEGDQGSDPAPAPHTLGEEPRRPAR